MARFEITAPNGSRYEVTAPDNATEADIAAYIKKQVGGDDKIGALEAGLRGASQGLTFGFGDELYGAGRGALSFVQGKGFSDEYAKARDENRAMNKKAAQDSPFAYYGGEIAGGVALPFGAARTGARLAARLPGTIVEPIANAGRTAGFGQLAANAQAGLGARTLAGAREGVAYGTLYGLGEGEGSPENILLSGVRGGLAGGTVGGAVPGLVDAGAAVARSVTTPIRAALNPQAVGREKMAEALMRDFAGEAPGQPGYGEAFNRLTNHIDAAQEAGKNVMLADVGGENTRNLLRAAANQQSTNAERLRKRLDTRQGNQWHRISNDIEAPLGGQRYGVTQAELEATRSQDAERAYRAAYDTEMTPQAATEIGAYIASRPYMQRLYDLTTQNVQGMRGTHADLNPWEMLHRTRMQIDQQLRNLRRGQPDPVANWTANDLGELRREFSGLLGRHNDAFRAANGRFADQSAILNAAEDGFQNFKSMPIEELAQRMAEHAQAGPAVAEAFRMGAGRNLIGDVMRGNRMRDRTENIFSSPEIAQRLEVIFPSRQQLRQFQRQLVIEAKMADTRKAVQGGPTTAKQLAQADEAGQPLRMATGVAQAATGRMEPVLNFMGRTAQRFSGITPSTANAIIAAAMERDPVRVRRSLERAMQNAQNAPEARAMVAQELIAGASSINDPGPLRVPIGGDPVSP